jgi:hypothetical protein
MKKIISDVLYSISGKIHHFRLAEVASFEISSFRAEDSPSDRALAPTLPLFTLADCL